jgi:hypothetical protein
MFRLKMFSQHQPQLQKYKRVLPSCQAYSRPGTDKRSFAEITLEKLRIMQLTFAFRFDNGN